MINRKLLLEKQVLNSLKYLNEQESEDYYEINAKEFEELFELSGKHPNVTKLKRFQGKPLLIKGNLDLRGSKINNLGKIAKVVGNLDISSTNIESLGNTIITGHIWDSNTPLRKKKDMEEIQEKKDNMSEDRINKTREVDNPTIDDVDLKAIAVYKILQSDGEVNKTDEEIEEKIKSLELELEELNKKYDESDNSEEYGKIYDRILEIEEELGDLKPEFDVYDLYEKRYTHYGLTTFEILEYSRRDKEYAVGTEEEMDKAAMEYAKSYIDDVGLDGFNSGFVDDCINERYFESYVREFYEDDIRYNPEVYFNDEDYSLTSEQEERIEELQKYVETLEQFISDKEDEQSELENEIEEPEDYKTAYEEIQKLIDDATTKKETAEEEIEGIKPDTDEPTEEMIEDALDSRISDANYNRVSWIREHGGDIRDFIDNDEFANKLVQSDGWGVMNNYDGHYDYVRIEGNLFYVMRVN